MPLKNGMITTKMVDITNGEIMKDYKGELKDILVGAVAALLMIGIPMAVYVYRTGGIS